MDRIQSLACAAFLLFQSTAVAQSERPGACVDQLVKIVPCANPAEVCRLLLKGRHPHGEPLERLFELEKRELGDDTPVYVFTQRGGGGDRLAYRPNLHFVHRGRDLELLFDGEGVRATYATARPRVNGRYQIERATEADIPGLYRKREVETWFWSGRKYEKAFSRVTIDRAKDPTLNGTKLIWNGDAEELYRSAGPSWTYTVESGDTLGAIAKRFRVPTDEIMRQNGIAKVQSLRVGQRLRYEGWKANAR